MIEKSEYKSLAEWKATNKSAYNAAKKRGLLRKLCLHYGWPLSKEKSKPKNKWTKDNCIEEARKYNTIKEWRKNSGSSYTAAHRYKCINKCVLHMIKLWNRADKEDIISDAKKYKTKIEWKNNSKNKYQVALSNGWLNECCKHMIQNQKPRGYWDIKENVFNEAKKYSTKTEWARVSTSSYQAAYRNKWVTECSKHMVKKK